MAAPVTSLTIVTGSSRGLGAHIALQSLRPGAQVLGLARGLNPAFHHRTAAAGGASGEQWQVDLAEAGPVAERLQRWLGDVDASGLTQVALINNACLLTPPGPLEAPGDAKIVAALRVGLEAAILLTAAFLRATRAWSADRRILNISSGLGRRAMAGSAVYCAVKAGMDHYSRALALEQAAEAHGARVVSLAPGVIDTDMQLQLRSSDPNAFADRESFVRLHRDGQLTSPADAAAQVLAYLARDDFGNNPVADVRQP